jgi:hypothetical protein
MALGLSPFVHGAERTDPRRIGVPVAHVAGGLAGGLAAAVALWLLASPARTLVPASVPVLFASAALAAIAYDVGRMPWARAGRQVPATWNARYGPARGFALYGAALGIGIVTYVPYGAAFCFFAAVALLPSFPVAVAAGAAFGLLRSTLAVVGACSPGSFSRLFYRSSAAQAGWRCVSVAATAASVCSVWSIWP